jgi:hypothetical protein
VVAAPSERASHARKSVAAPAILGPPRNCGPRTTGAIQAGFKKKNESQRHTNFQLSTFSKEAP